MEGANIAIGGKTDASQNYIEPTVLVDCQPRDAAMQNEVRIVFVLVHVQRRTCTCSVVLWPVLFVPVPVRSHDSATSDFRYALVVHRCVPAVHRCMRLELRTRCGGSLICQCRNSIVAVMSSAAYAPAPPC